MFVVNWILSGNIKGSVTVYQHTDFSGWKKQFGIGPHDIDELNFANDTISSLKVSGNVKVKLFEHAKFEGKMQEFEKGDWSDLRKQGFNDKVSSIIVEEDGGKDDTEAGMPLRS